MARYRKTNRRQRRHPVWSPRPQGRLIIVWPEPHVADEKREKPNSGRLCCSVADLVQGFSCSADRRCDHCGRLGASGHWDWPGRPDGIWLHKTCEQAWYDSEGSP
jgi:hypothetical protein